MLSIFTYRRSAKIVWIFGALVSLASSIPSHAQANTPDEMVQTVDAPAKQDEVGALSAVIESCQGWRLNKYPIVKEFLMSGDMESYENVEVTWTRGKPPVMTTYLSGEQHEQIDLLEVGSTEKLHDLMKEKGFVTRPEEEVQAIKKKRQEQQMEKQRQKEKRRQELEERKRHRELERQERKRKQEEGNGHSKTKEQEEAREERKRQLEQEL